MSKTRDLANLADLNFDSGTMVVDKVNDRVGIGTDSPTGRLNVVPVGNIGGSAGTMSNAALRIGTTAASSMYFDTNEIHGSETLNLFSNGTDNGVTTISAFQLVALAVQKPPDWMQVEIFWWVRLQAVEQ